MKISIFNSGWFGFSASQRRRSKVLGGLILLLISILGPQGRAEASQTGTIVSPAPPQGQFGNAGINLGLGWQQIHANTEFSSLSSDVIAITGVAFRWSERTVSTAVVIPYVGIGLGTFTKPLSEMSVRDYENRGSDYRSVFVEENVRMIAQSPSSPSEFNVKFEFNEPFYYDRRSGHLILGLGVGTPPGTPLFAWDAELGRNLRDRVQYLSLTALGNIDVGGLVTQFYYTPVPEISTLSILVFGAILILAGKKIFQ